MQGIVTVIILPIIYFPINAYLSNKFNNNPRELGKNAYRNFLIKNSKPISDLFYKLEKYKHDTTFKDLFFIEGIPIGFLFFMYLFLFSITLSKNRELNKIIIFTPYYNYFYNGYKDVDLLGVVLSFNFFIVITIGIMGLLLAILYLKRYNDPKLTEKSSLKKLSICVYYSYWFSIGLLIGLNISVLFFAISFGNIILNFIKILPNIWKVVWIISYSAPFFGSLMIMGILYRETKYFSNRFKRKVTNFYIDNFPNVRIKTTGEDISGKIDDMHNESLIILNEGGKVKAIRWDQITTMEIERSEENNKDLHEVVKNNKPLWKFW